MGFVKTNKKKFSLYGIILLLSPIVDLIISIIQRNFSSLAILGTGIRGLLLVSILIYTFLVRKEKNTRILNYLIALIIYILFFVLYKGMDFAEITTIIKFFFFPLMLGCFLLHKEELTKVKNEIYISGIIYMLFLIVPLLLGTTFNSYENLKSGSVGWFSSANEISAIVSLICPFIFFKTIEEKKEKNKILFFAISLLFIYSIFSIGTKVPVLATIISLVLFLITLIFKTIANKKELKSNVQNIILTFILIISSIIIFFTGVGYENILLQKKKYEVNNNIQTEVNPNIKEEFDNNNLINKIEAPKVDIGENYSTIYQEYILEDKQEIIEYRSPKIINMLFSSRDVYFIRKLSVWNNSDIITKLFGMGNKYTYDNEVTQKLVEIDFIDVFFNYGIIGFTLYFGLVFYLILNIIINILKNLKQTIKNNNLHCFVVGIMLSIIISVFAGHILGAPAVSLLAAIILVTFYNETEKISLTKEKYFNKKRIIIIIIITLLSIMFGLMLKSSSNVRNDKINITYDNNNIKVKGIFKYAKLIEEKNIESKYAKDNLKYYHIKKGNNLIMKLVMVNRTFDNGITWTFFTGNNISDFEHTIIINNKKKINNVEDFKKYEIKKEYSYSVGYDKMSLPSLYGTGKNNFLLVYKTYVYDIKLMKYDSINYSILKNLIEEKNSSYYDDKKVTTTFKIDKNEIFDQLYISSKKGLLKNKEEKESYINIINNGYSSPWITFNGPNTKLAYSIEPYTTEGYGRNLGSTLEKHMFREYENTNNKFFESFALSSLHLFEKYLPRNNSGVWLTEYTSTWIKKDYGIKALYFDTRHNDSIADYMRNLSNFYKDEDLLKTSHYYADYLVYQYKRGNITKFKEGVLTPDYFSTHHDLNTHTSLNHQLAIINYLFKCFIETDNNEYKELALTYLKTIEKMGNKWIKSDKDLHYSINSEGKMDGMDYATLTLEDLLVTQNLLEDIGEKRSKELDKLIKAKLSYLKNINYNFDSYLTKQLEEGGYSD